MTQLQQPQTPNLNTPELHTAEAEHYLLMWKLQPAFLTFFRHLFTRGTSTFVIVFGRRETGKTDFALLIAEILSYLGVFTHIATNIRIYTAPFPIEHITNLDTLRTWSETVKGRKLFLFDEYGKAFRRRKPMSSLNIELIDDLQVLRKHRLSTVAITPAEKYVDNVSLGSDVLDGVFRKPHFKNQKIAVYIDLLEDRFHRFQGIPSTSIRFDSWDVAPFTQHGPDTVKPKFKDEDMQKLWLIVNGATGAEFGWHQQTLNRKWKKALKFLMEKHASHVTSP